MKTIIRNCDKCGKVNAINCVTGLCPSCEKKVKIKELELKLLKGEGLNESELNILWEYKLNGNI